MTQFLTRKLGIEDLQLVRYWRNKDHVRIRMASQNLIDIEGQRRWFENLDHQTAEHYIYSLDLLDIGSVNITKIDREQGTFEVGLYCGDTDYLGHWVNIAACIFIYDHAFNQLNLKESTAIILDSNKQAISLNKALGYVPSGRRTDDIGTYLLTKENYEARSRALRHFIEKQAPLP